MARLSPTASIILPVYNGEKYVAATVASVLQQTFTDWELVIVDDGSTDQSAAILQAYAGDPRIKVHRQPNRGLAAARNQGLALAHGEFLAFLDADDLWPPAYLEQATAALRGHPGAVLAAAGWRYIDSDGRPLPQTSRLTPAQMEALRQELDWRNVMVPSGVVVRRAETTAAGGFDVALQSCEDWDLWLRLRPAGSFVAVPEIVVSYRTHGENMSNNIERMERERFNVLAKNRGAAWTGSEREDPYLREVRGYFYFVSAIAYFHHRNVEAGTGKLQQAIELRPGLVAADEFYYELGCAFQPPGYRGSAVGLRLPESAKLIHALLFKRLKLPGRQEPGRLWGRACLTLAQLAYENGQRRSSASYALRAVWFLPWATKPAAVRALARALVPRSTLQQIRVGSRRATAAQRFSEQA